MLVWDWGLFSFSLNNLISRPPHDIKTPFLYANGSRRLHCVSNASPPA
uniref:Uncharacterized protein n=1 Tax=Picea glauca TaxID=3330 RepID=A0A101LZ80_PICGL|nr:hypothetical protein ABT39_MTgene5087 [Picea glauca]